MATLSDGTTTLTFDTVSESVDKIISSSRKTSAGGNHKIQIAGYRFQIDVKVRMTPAKYNQFKDLMISGALEYSYTPFNKDSHPIYVGAEMPIKCTIRKGGEKDFDNEKINHIDFVVDGSKLISC